MQETPRCNKQLGLHYCLVTEDGDHQLMHPRNGPPTVMPTTKPATHRCAHGTWKDGDTEIKEFS